MSTLLIFGLGYCGRAVAAAAAAAGLSVAATTRSSAAPDPAIGGNAAGHRLAPREPFSAGEAVVSARETAVSAGETAVSAGETVAAPQACAANPVPFAAAESAIAAATHILVTVPPGDDGDPVLNRYADAIATAPRLRWIGYLSSTVVYGDRAGAWVDEATPPAPSQPRGKRRLDAERAWSDLASRYAIDLFRLAGIYGPGRSAFDDLRAGKARRMNKPGHRFGRIHRDDIGQAVTAAMRQPQDPGVRVLNLVDDIPAESAAVVTEAARLLGLPPPPEIAFADAYPAMSSMARSFWAENRKVSSRTTQRALGLRWLYPGFHEGLAAIWREESGQRSP